MRPSILIVFALALVALASFLFIGGRGVVERSAAIAPAAPPAEIAAEPVLPVVAEPAPQRSPAASRQVAPDIVAPSGLEADELQWAAPREPLSQLSLALPPKPKMPDDWKGTTLFRPVATASAVFESMGYRVAIAGTESVAPDETCISQGVSWPCGVRARTAFRLWLRGRALICAVPPEADRAILAAPCRLGKQDAGAWLVSNGWARAAPGGPYGKAEETAKKAGMGIFGPPPGASGLPPNPESTAATPPAAPTAPAQ